MDLVDSLQLAVRHLRSGEPAKCVALCDRILDANPGLIQALYLRGCAAYETGDLSRSVADLEVVYGNHPEHLHAAFYLGRSLRAAGNDEEALEPLQAAAADEELEGVARYDLATCLARLRRRAEAIEQYRHILKRQPDNAQVAANLASLLERENRLEEAEDWTARALSLDAANETARMTRAVLDRRSGHHPEAERSLRELISEIDNPVNLCIAWNQLGQCLEGQSRWDAAFDAFAAANRTLQDHHPRARPDRRDPHSLQTLARIHDWLQGNPTAVWREPATEDSGGIAFLVGFPRSGTTLLDRMLSGHPEIEVLEEKSLFSSLHQDWSAAGTLEALAQASDERIADARNIYRQQMSRHRLQVERSLAVDKLPLNLAYLFLIYRLFPNAPVIFLQRHPMDACISCFFQAFELQASMAYFLDLDRTAEYYDAVMQVAMASLAQIGNPVQSLRYEELVADPGGQLTQLTDFLGLQMHDSMLDHRIREAGNTPSYQQVSQPLYGRSIGRWRHYSKQLEPVRPVLQPWVERLGYREVLPPTG